MEIFTTQKYFKLFFKHFVKNIWIFSRPLKHQMPVSLPPPQAPLNSNNSAPLVYTSPPYAEHQNYLQMLGAYLTPTATGYKCVDPYFLSQGNEQKLKKFSVIKLKLNLNWKIIP